MKHRVLLSLLFSTFAGAAAAAEPATAPAPGGAATMPDANASTSGDAAAEGTGPDGQPLESCGSAYERAQTERLAGHYVAASAAALVCSQLRCNPAIVRECVRFYEALEQDTPTFVLSARKAEGGELVDVRVEMDGKPVAEQITGRPFAVDPGQHEFVFTHAERGRVKVTETARVGDHARVVEASFTDPFAKPAASSAASTDLGPPPRKTIPVMTYVLGGVVVVGLAGFIGFRLRADNDYNDYHTVCSPRCKPDDVDAIRREYLISYVSLGVGAAALAGAGVVYFATGNHESQPVQASVTPLAGGALAGLKTRF